MCLTAIERIHAAAKAATSASLDQQVHLDTNISIYSFADTDAKQRVYVDVPCDRVVALSRSDFWVEGDTWRTIVGRIHGEGWTNEVFNYFDSPLEENSFPAPSSRFELRLLSVGGICECSNGNHRVVAGRAWLSERDEDKAHFKLAKTRCFPVHSDVVGFLADAANEKSGVRHASPRIYPGEKLTIGNKEIELFLSTTKNPERIFAWVEGELILVKNKPSNFLSRLFSRNDVSDVLVWRTIPLPLVQGLLDDSWVRAQLSSAKTWDL
jgi:hypothetical protein